MQSLHHQLLHPEAAGACGCCVGEVWGVGAGVGCGVGVGVRAGWGVGFGWACWVVAVAHCHMLPPDLSRQSLHASVHPCLQYSLNCQVCVPCMAPDRQVRTSALVRPAAKH